MKKSLINNQKIWGKVQLFNIQRFNPSRGSRKAMLKKCTKTRYVQKQRLPRLYSFATTTKKKKKKVYNLEMKNWVFVLWMLLWIWLWMLLLWIWLWMLLLWIWLWSIAMQHHLTISPKPFMTVLLIFVVVEPPRFICAFTLYMAMQAIVSGNELQFACDYTRRQDSHHATLHLVILTG